MIKSFKIGLTFVVLVFGSSYAQAACVLSDLTGTWLLQGVGGNVSGNCKISFNRTGNVAVGSTCRYYEPESLVTVTVKASGRLSLENPVDCAFTGNLSIGGSDASTAMVKLYMSDEKDTLKASGPVISTNAVDSYGKDEVVVFSAFKRSQ
jgi:hypothetical protein